MSYRWAGFLQKGRLLWQLFCKSSRWAGLLQKVRPTKKVIVATDADYPNLRNTYQMKNEQIGVSRGGAGFVQVKWREDWWSDDNQSKILFEHTSKNITQQLKIRRKIKHPYENIQAFQYDSFACKNLKLHTQCGWPPSMDSIDGCHLFFR